MPWSEHHAVERRAAWSRDYYSRNRISVLGYKAKWVRENPEKRRAQVAVGNAIRDGRLYRPPECSACGETGRVTAHHDDYSEPLVVRWLCPTCHGKEHRIVMTEFEIVTELPQRKQGTTRTSKYTEFWAFVNDHPGSWVKWPYPIGKGTGNLAKHHGFKFAKRNGECFFQKEAE